MRSDAIKTAILIFTMLMNKCWVTAWKSLLQHFCMMTTNALYDDPLCTNAKIICTFFWSLNQGEKIGSTAHFISSFWECNSKASWKWNVTIKPKLKCVLSWSHWAERRKSRSQLRKDSILHSMTTTSSFLFSLWTILNCLILRITTGSHITLNFLLSAKVSSFEMMHNGSWW